MNEQTEREIWICERLALLGMAPPLAILSKSELAAHVRLFLDSNGGGMLVIGKRQDGKPLMSGYAFETTFGEKL